MSRGFDADSMARGFREAIRLIPSRVGFGVERLVQSFEYAMHIDYFPRDCWRARLAECAVREYGAPAIVSLLTDGVRWVHHVRECEEGIRDLVDQ